MKKVRQIKKSSITALILVILLILLIGATGTYVSDLREKQIRESSEKEQLYSFDFSASECLDYDEDIGLEILETSWIDENKLQIKTKVVLNCADEMIGGNFEYNDTTKTLYLNYNVIIYEIIPDCVCLYDLKYIITIEKGEYNLELIRNDYIGW